MREGREVPSFCRAWNLDLQLKWYSSSSELSTQRHVLQVISKGQLVYLRVELINLNLRKSLQIPPMVSQHLFQAQVGLSKVSCHKHLRPCVPFAVWSSANSVTLFPFLSCCHDRFIPFFLMLWHKLWFSRVESLFWVIWLPFKVDNPAWGVDQLVCQCNVEAILTSYDRCSRICSAHSILVLYCAIITAMICFMLSMFFSTAPLA